MWWQKWMKGQSAVGVHATADTADINKTDINVTHRGLA
jgi:hypothetical protein